MVDMATVAGANNRESNRIMAFIIEKTDAEMLQGFVRKHTKPCVIVYTDESRASRGRHECDHEAFSRSVPEYVRKRASANGIELLWFILKHEHLGIYHKFSPKHPNRFALEFAGRHNDRDADMIDQIAVTVAGMERKRPRYSDLIADNRLSKGAQ